MAGREVTGAAAVVAAGAAEGDAVDVDAGAAAPRFPAITRVISGPVSGPRRNDSAQRLFIR